MTARRFRDLAGNDAYELIGVAVTASRAEIRRAYRRQMLRTHPDHGGSEDQAKLINCALEILMSDRAGYDEYRRRKVLRIPPQQPRRPAARSADSEPGLVDDDPLNEWDDADVDADDGDPWAEAEDGVGEPGYGGSAPGTGKPPQPEHPEPEPPDFEDIVEDDRPYRPFATDRPQEAEPWSMGHLLNTPMVVGVVLFFLAVVAVIANAGNESTTPYSAGRSLVVPTYAYQNLYPTPTRDWSRYLDPAYPSSVLPGTVNRVLPTAPSLADSYLKSLNTITLLGSPDHSCRRTSSGQIRCSGENDDGQLGVGDRRAHTGLRALKGGHTWRAVTVGASHSCGIRQDRTLWCWGANDAGQLGTGKGKQDSTVARQVRGGYAWRSVAAWGDVTCAVRTSGSLWCWGSPLVKGADLSSSRVPDRYGLGNTWTKVRVQGSKLCAQRPRHPNTCLNV